MLYTTPTLYIFKRKISLESVSAFHKNIEYRYSWEKAHIPDTLLMASHLEKECTLPYLRFGAILSPLTPYLFIEDNVCHAEKSPVSSTLFKSRVVCSYIILPQCCQMKTFLLFPVKSGLAFFSPEHDYLLICWKTVSQGCRKLACKAEKSMTSLKLNPTPRVLVDAPCYELHAACVPKIKQDEQKQDKHSSIV